MMKPLWILLVFLSLQAHARVEVAFLEIQKPDGSRLELEHDGRFAHVAISYKGQWLQTHPYRGVEVVDLKKLQEQGHITSVLVSENLSEPSPRFVNSVIGTPYEAEYSWKSKNYYCSKLVGKVFGLRPLPMKFQSPPWDPKYKQYDGLLGLSPDEVFKQLKVLGFKEL